MLTTLIRFHAIKRIKMDLLAAGVILVVLEHKVLLKQDLMTLRDTRDPEHGAL